MRIVSAGLSFFILAGHVAAKDVPYKIAGGETVVLRLTEQGARPTKSEFFEIEEAGLLFNLQPGAPDVTSTFGFLFRKDLPVTRVLVEDVSDNEAVTLVDDTAPEIKKRAWSGITKARPIQSKDFAKMFERRITLSGFNPLKLLNPDMSKSSPFSQATGSVRVFRFSIFSEAKGRIVLYQPTWFNVRFLDQMELAIAHAERAEPVAK